ncbi:hypothetical protein AALA98_06175 [Lachnospiraceae bacterium 45-W7]
MEICRYSTGMWSASIRASGKYDYNLSEYARDEAVLDEVIREFF